MDMAYFLYSLEDMSHFVHLLVDGHLGYFHFLVIISNTATNIRVQVFT